MDDKRGRPYTGTVLRGWRSVARRRWGLALLAVVLAMCGLWLVFQHKPNWYQPAIVSQAVLRRARVESAAVVDEISRQMVQGRTFEVTLVDRMVNEWLAALPHHWPEVRGSTPPGISDLAVSFDDGRVRVGARYAHGGWRLVVNAGLTLNVSADGREMIVALADVRGGSLPVPRAVLRRIFRQALPVATPDRTRPARVAGGSSSKSRPTHAPGAAPASGNVTNARPEFYNRLESWFGEVRSIDDLFDGQATRNRFIWPNGKRPFRIDSIAVDDGELRLRLEPL